MPSDRIGIDKEIDSAIAYDFDTAVEIRLVYSDVEIREAEREASDKQIEDIKASVKRAR